VARNHISSYTLMLPESILIVKCTFVTDNDQQTREATFDLKATRKSEEEIRVPKDSVGVSQLSNRLVERQISFLPVYWAPCSTHTCSVL
jgi:hypothetical protein